jgi:hypothetical protein
MHGHMKVDRKKKHDLSSLAGNSLRLSGKRLHDGLNLREYRNISYHRERSWIPDHVDCGHNRLYHLHRQLSTPSLDNPPLSPFLRIFYLFLGAFTKLLQETVIFVMSVNRPSFCSRAKTRLPLNFHEIWYLTIFFFSKNLSTKFKFH